jgi:hypothetical protein
MKNYQRVFHSTSSIHTKACIRTENTHSCCTFYTSPPLQLEIQRRIYKKTLLLFFEPCIVTVTEGNESKNIHLKHASVGEKKSNVVKEIQQQLNSFPLLCIYFT